MRKSILFALAYLLCITGCVTIKNLQEEKPFRESQFPAKEQTEKQIYREDLMLTLTASYLTPSLFEMPG